MYELVDTKLGQKSACSNALVLKKKIPNGLCFVTFCVNPASLFLRKNQTMKIFTKMRLEEERNRGAKNTISGFLEHSK